MGLERNQSPLQKYGYPEHVIVSAEQLVKDLRAVEKGISFGRALEIVAEQEGQVIKDSDKSNFISIFYHIPFLRNFL